jgi:hypothetical protein
MLDDVLGLLRRRTDGDRDAEKRRWNGTEDGMQQDLEDRQQRQGDEEVPVGAILGFVLLRPMSLEKWRITGNEPGTLCP